MKFKCSVEINLARSEVVSIYDNPANMQYWQDDFISFHRQTGKQGQPGSTAKIKYKRVELLETVLENALPEAFHGSYEGSWGKNLMYNYFEEISPSTTRWTSEIEYIAMNNLMMKIMGKFFPNIFRKQTQKWMDQFKIFAENQSSQR